MKMNGKEKENGFEITQYLKQKQNGNGQKTYISFKVGEKGYDLVTKLRNVLRVEDLVTDLLEKWVNENKDALMKIGIEF